MLRAGADGTVDGDDQRARDAQNRWERNGDRTPFIGQINLI
jgi:hypothetical protein